MFLMSYHQELFLLVWSHHQESLFPGGRTIRSRCSFQVVVPSGAVVLLVSRAIRSRCSFWVVVPSGAVVPSGVPHQEPLFLPGGRAIRAVVPFWEPSEPLFLLVWSCHQEPLFLS